MSFRFTLSKNMQGAAVEEAQEHLIRTGYGALLGPTQADKNFGTLTKNAVIAFQLDHGLKPDGVIGEKTFTALEAAPDAAPQKKASIAPAIRNPIAAAEVETIRNQSLFKTVSYHPAPTKEKPAAEKPETHFSGSSRKLTTGEVRVAQSYLRVMDYFGPMKEVRGIKVVHGKLDVRTQNALKEFVDDHGKTYGLASPAPTVKLLNSIVAAHTTFLEKKMEIASRTNPAYMPEHEAAYLKRMALAHMFETKRPEFREHYDMLKTVHPEMRFPALSAIQELKKIHHLDVVIKSAYRSPDKQTGHILRGESTAPPGYSFHSHGLALDIYPADAKGNAIMNTRDPKWQKLYDVMVAHGFYSMMREQKWDPPHHELPAATSDMILWPKGRDGWQDIPRDVLPGKWLEANQNALSGSVTPGRIYSPKGHGASQRTK